MTPFYSKNVSPRSLALFASFLVAIITGLLSLFLAPKGWVPFATFLVVFVLCYVTFFYTLQHFIYRKIKLIYKFIYQTKATQREAFFNEKILPQKSMEEVSRDVERWASQKKDEIESLRKNEAFRKEFLLNLSHELRTPIFTIQGYLHSLLSGGIDDETVSRRFLENANKGVQRLVELVADVNEISKLESGQTMLQKSSFVIQDLVHDVYGDLLLNAGGKNISLELKKGTEPKILVYADREKIGRVLINLVENAIKYGREGGNVITGCYELDDDLAYIEVSDNGYGIEEQYLPRVFERFYRVDKSRNRGIGGSGLGLAIVKHIVEAHGQTINVRSKPNVGSSFGFTLAKAKK